MNIEEIREYCLCKENVSESFPFDNDTLVFKVSGKIFALINLIRPLTINLKCKPEKAADLREQYNFVKPGYHMNKIHWNTIELEEGVPDKLLKQWIDDSYQNVISGLTKREKQDYFD